MSPTALPLTLLLLIPGSCSPDSAPGSLLMLDFVQMLSYTKESGMPNSSM